VVGGVIGALTNLGIPPDTAGYYAEGIRRGGTLIAVRTEDYMSDRAVEVMNRHQPVNLKEQAGVWRQSGWTGFDAGSRETAQEQHRMQEMEDRQIPDTGAGQQGPYGSAPGMAGGVMTQSPYGTGRNVSGSDSEHNQNVRGEQGLGSDMPLRESHPEMTDVPTGMGRDYGDYSIYDARFRSDFQRSPFSRDYTYEEYAPAYHYGYDLAHDNRYVGQRWDDIEPGVRRDWERDHPNTWDRFKDSIHNAWEDVKDALD
jgi:hypothetical protein